MIRFLRGASATGIEPLTPVRECRAGEESLAVECSIDVGVERRRVRLVVGSWPIGEPDPGGPGGLLGLPVVLLSPTLLPHPVRVGLARTGAAPRTLDGALPDLGIRLLVAEPTADVVVIDPADARHLRLVRLLGGRAVAVPPIGDEAATRAMFEACDVDVEVAVPSLEGAARAEVRRGLAGIGAPHHVVEVDPRPALEDLGRRPDSATLAERFGLAAGILAGRLAAERRRWRAG